jgi:O-antigen ligase
MSARNREDASAGSGWLLVERARLVLAADWLAVAVAAALPWSISAILIALWLVTVLPTLDVASVRRELMSPAGGLPVLLWAIALVGMSWADVDWRERLDGLGGLHKLLLIPLLLAHFRRSANGRWVLIGFLASAVAVLALSWAIYFIAPLNWMLRPIIDPKIAGVPVRDYVAQSGMFTICVLALLGVAVERWRAGRWDHALALVVLAAVFAVNVLYVATGRTALVAFIVLIPLFGLQQFGWKGTVVACLVGCAIAGVVWFSSHYMRVRIQAIALDLQSYSVNRESSIGNRLDFYRNSIAFIVDAPVIGHGTGSIEAEFRKAQKSDPTLVPTKNPHNQIFTIAIQLGMLGAAVLVAMWIAHIALFCAPGLIAWLGLVVVLQNVVGSLFNSHIGDFMQGWLYVFGVGVLGAMMQRSPRPQAPGF